MNMSTLALHRSPELISKMKNLEKSKTNIDNNYSDINQRNLIYMRYRSHTSPPLKEASSIDAL